MYVNEYALKCTQYTHAQCAQACRCACNDICWKPIQCIDMKQEVYRPVCNNNSHFISPNPLKKKNAIPFFMFFLSRYPIYYYYYFFIFPSCFYFYFILPVAPFVTSFSFFPWFVWFFNPAFLLSWFLLNLFCHPYLLHPFIIFFFCDPFFYRSKFSVQTFEWLSISSDFVGPACVPQV